MRSSPLPFHSADIGQEEIESVAEALQSGWLTTGPKVRQFEKEFARYLGAPAALALNSCTAALHLGLSIVGVGQGDAVITTPLTFCSTVHVIEHTGARPVFADVSSDTLNIEPDGLDRVFSESRATGGAKVKAILPVHLYGHPADMDTISRLADSHQVKIIEDAAHALPAAFGGRVIGSTGNLTAFSFYATKNLTTGEGGMLTGPPKLIEQARLLSLHGMSRDAWRRYSGEGSWFYEVHVAGFKYNMGEIAAAIGLQQLKKLSAGQQRRRNIVSQYNTYFSNCEELQCPAHRPGVDHAWHLYALRLNLERLTLSRDQFINELRARNIETSVHFIPVHMQPYYRDKYGYKPEDFPVALREYQRVLSLPLYPRMTNKDVEDVAQSVIDVVSRFRR